MPLLELDAYGVDIGETSALGNLSIKLGDGQSMGVAGGAGSGKTLLARAIGGLLPPNAKVFGQIYFDRTRLPSSEQAMARLRGRRIGLLFGGGEAVLDPLRSPLAQLADALRRFSPGHPADTDARALLAECGLDTTVADLMPADLSPLETRQAQLAMALAGRPGLLVADDPARDLDPVSASTLLALIAALVRQRGIAQLLLVRDFRALEASCKDVLILRGGRVVEFGTPAQVFGRPQDEFTRDYVTASRMRTRTLMRSPIGTDLLSVSGLVFPLPRERGTTAHRLADVSFSVRRSEAVAIVGAARSGKSAIGRIVGGLQRPRAGTLVFEHDPYRGDDLPRHRRREVSLVFADPAKAFSPRFPIAASVMEPLRLEPQLLIEEQAERMVEAIRAVGLDPAVLREPPTSFTLDELWRFALARGLIARPRLLILDDFADGLDVTQRSELIALMGRLRSDYGLSVLLLDRDIEVARAVADRLLILHEGRIVEEGRPAALIEAPQHELTRALVKARLPEVGPQPTTTPL